MPDLHVSVFATPGTHKDIEKEVNGWRYDVEGVLAKGTQAPVLMKHQHYSVRLQDSIKEQFIRDFNLMSGIQAGLNGRANFVTRTFLKTFNWCIRRLPFLKAIDRNINIPQKHKINTWKYNVTIGEVQRTPVPVKTGGKREVL